MSPLLRRRNYYQRTIQRQSLLLVVLGSGYGVLIGGIFLKMFGGF